jgi:hypothetical protein
MYTSSNHSCAALLIFIAVEQIMEGKFDFPSPYWDHVSDAGLFLQHIGNAVLTCSIFST